MSVILITGATAGIGKAIAKFMVHTHHLILVSRNKQKLQEYKNELQALNSESFILTIDIDLTEKSFNHKILSACVENEIIPDIIINNFGLYPLDEVSDLGFSDKLMSTLNANLFSASKIVDAFLPFMKDKQEGRIINIGSQLSKNIRKESASYTISKHAMYAYHKLLLSTLKPYNIHCSMILPGSTNTESWSEAPSELRSSIIQPNAVANAVQFIINSDLSAIPDEISLIASHPDWI